MYSKVIDKNIMTLIHSQPVLGSFILDNNENTLVSLTENRLYLWTRTQEGSPSRECDYTNVYYMNQQSKAKYVCMRKMGEYIVVGDSDGFLNLFTVRADIYEVQLQGVIPSIKGAPVVTMTYANHNLFVLHTLGRLVRFLNLDRAQNFPQYMLENEKNLVPISLNKKCKLIEAHQYGGDGDALPDLLFAQDGANLAVYGYMPDQFSLVQPLQRFGYVSPKLQKPDASVIHATALKVVNNVLVVGNKYGYVATYKVILLPLDDTIQYNTTPAQESKSRNSSRLGNSNMNRYERKLKLASDIYGSPLIRLQTMQQVVDFRTHQKDFHLSFQPIQSFWNHGRAISSVTINYYTLQLISFDVNGFCTVTDLKHNIVQQKYIPHCDIVTSSLIDYKCHVLLTGSKDHTVKLWHSCIPSEEELEQMRQIDETMEEYTIENGNVISRTATHGNAVNEVKEGN